MCFSATTITWNKQSTTKKHYCSYFFLFFCSFPLVTALLAIPLVFPAGLPLLPAAGTLNDGGLFLLRSALLLSLSSLLSKLSSFSLSGVFLFHSCPLYQAPLCRLHPLSEEYPPPILKPSSSSLSLFLSFNSGVSSWVYQLLSSFTTRVLVIVFVVCCSCFWRNM